MSNLIDIRHPLYSDLNTEWIKWRYVFNGGHDFVDNYVKEFSSRESTTDYNSRLEISYCAAFAKAAVLEIKNSIFQRLVDVSRTGGPKSYNDAIKGLGHGVDRKGSSMMNFLGVDILPELLPMGRVGVFVDMPSEVGYTLKDAQDKTPYFYTYRTEDILTWVINPQQDYSMLLLRDYVYSYEETFGLPDGEVERYRLLELTDEGVKLRFYNDSGKQTDYHGNPSDEHIILNLTKIPFVLFDLGTGLLCDIADHQVALTNLESSDIMYILKSNFPFYTEQFDPRITLPNLKPSEAIDTDSGNPGEAAVTNIARDPEIKIGIAQGRRYGSSLDRPGFIHPSPEPLLASIKKQEQIKADIRLLVNLTISNLSAKMASAESKARDQDSLECGLSFIGLVLEHGENELAKIWSMYTGEKDVARITYPENYDLKTDKERFDEAKDVEGLMQRVPSDKFKRASAKRIIRILYRGKVTDAELQAMYDEIDSSPAIVSDPKVLAEDWKNGFVDTEMASKLRGYPEGTVEQAKKDHAERLARIREAQGGEGGEARGDGDTQVSQPTGQEEKEGKEKRGEARL